ncbi:MAG TPA: flavin reductase family protein [Candidatus Cloacimonadota bacterium]|nr:flavin reductase family protein [Candidatus Cloacimonadota bacterium]HOQ80897.1 flavin reductase family protein [Candidatus Cloacimonadota bacterium]
MKVEEISAVIKESKPPFTPLLIVSQDENGKANVMVVEWYMRCSAQPPMYAISVGLERHTHKCLEQVRLFNMIVPTSNMTDIVKYCGSQSGKDVDKFTELKLDTFKGKLGLPIIKNANATLECKIVSQILSGDHTIFIGEVKHSWLNDESSPLVLYPKNNE